MRPVRHAIIVSGGTGARFGNRIPKQFHRLGNRPVLLWSVETFLGMDGFASMVVVSHPDWMERTGDSLKSCKDRKCGIHVAAGGSRRQDSCLNGLNALEAEDGDLVLIHDAARPLVTSELIGRVIRAAATVGAAVPVIASPDSLANQSDGIITSYIDRSAVVCIQTPQGFQLGKIRAAHIHAHATGSPESTDDGSMVLAAGFPVACVPGDPRNIKITSLDDLKTAESLLA